MLYGDRLGRRCQENERLNLIARDGNWKSHWQFVGLLIEGIATFTPIFATITPYLATCRPMHLYQDLVYHRVIFVTTQITTFILSSTGPW